MKKSLFIFILFITLLPTAVFGSTIAFPSEMTKHNFFFLGEEGGKTLSWTMLDLQTVNYPLAVSQVVLSPQPFDEGGSSRYQDSSLRQYLDGSFYADCFSAEEKKLITDVGRSETASSDWQAPTPIPADKGFYFFPLSATEARRELLEYGMLSINSHIDRTPAGYWLRSPHQTIAGRCGEVLPEGEISSKKVTESSGVRPAFCMDFSSVVFVRKAVQEEYGAVGRVEKNDFNRSGEYKFCILSEELSLSIDSTSYDPTTKLISVSYHSAAFKKDTYLSAIVVNNSNIIRGYGRLKKITKDSGTVVAEMPFDLKEEGLTLHFFLEEGNSDSRYDIATRPILAAVTIAAVTRPLPIWFWCVLIAIPLCCVLVFVYKKRKES